MGQHSICDYLQVNVDGFVQHVVSHHKVLKDGWAIMANGTVRP